MKTVAGDRFRAALRWLLKKEGKGAQARLSREQLLDPGHLNSIIKGRTPGPEETRETIAGHFKMTYEDMLGLGRWLLDGNDPEVFLEQSGKVFFRDTRMVEPETQAAQGEDQFSISDMIIMTTKVLESRTVYRSALASNIRAFHQAVTRESEMEDMRNDMARMQREIRELRDLITAGGQKKPGGDCDKDADQRKAAG
jgi:hypothetical protein